MIPGTLLLVTACGPDTNPKESGWKTITTKGGEFREYFFCVVNGWHDRAGNPVSPDFWFKPVGPVEYLQKEAAKDAWNAKDELNLTQGCIMFPEFEDYWTKKQEEK